MNVRPCSRIHARTEICILNVFQGNSGYVNATHCYVIRTLLVLFSLRYILISRHGVKHGGIISYLQHVKHWNANSNLTDMFDSLSKDRGVYTWECSIKMYEMLLWWRVKSRKLETVVSWRHWCTLFLLLRNDLVKKKKKGTEVVCRTKLLKAKNGSIHLYCWS